MTKLQQIVIGACFLLFLVLFFGFGTKSNEQKQLEMSRVQSFETLGVDNLLKDAKESLPSEKIDLIHFFEKEIQDAENDSIKIELLKRLSGEWYELKEYALSGHYASQIAEIIDQEDAWSIAGTTFAIGIKNYQDQKKKDYCTDKAIQSFENALSVNPNNLQHRVNMALCYTENPPKDNPMQGIVMLLDLNKKHPDNIPVMQQLARLAIQTGQFEKAILRLNKILSLDENNKKAICMLVDAHAGAGNQENARLFEEKCLNYN